MRDAAFAKAFSLFLRRTNEKNVILRAIRREVRLTRKMSLLDIGGGDGSLTIPLSRLVGRTVVIEPNRHFARRLSAVGLECINQKWEDVTLQEKFDLILAAYVVTYFPQENLDTLIRKMLGALKRGGKLILLAVDEQKGSWRGIHTYFYKLIGVQRTSSTRKLKEIAEKNHGNVIPIRTYVRVRNEDEALDILALDFDHYKEKFTKNKERLKKYLSRKKRHGAVVFDMVHWMFVLSPQRP